MKKKLIFPLLIIISAALVVIFSPTLANLNKAEKVEVQVTREKIEVQVTREVVTSIPVSTPVPCSPTPADVTLQAEPISESEIALTLTGLQPGEKLIFVFASEIPGVTASEIEQHPIKEVGADGSYEFVQIGLHPLDTSGSSPNTWDVKVIRSTGALCTQVTLP